MIDAAELRALARAVAIDPRLEVQLGRAGSGWFITPSTSVINADSGDLAREHPDDVRGLLCHEAAHAAVTRYLHLVPMVELKRAGMASLLNALEDCRIETWLVARLPGTEPWVARYNNRLFPADSTALGGLSWMEQFCLGSVHHWWHGTLPEGLDDTPRDALIATAAARQAVVEALPPLSAVVPVGEALAYDDHPVRRRFAARDRYAPPDGFERLIRMRAYEAWRVTWLDIRPVYLELVRRDLATFPSFKSIEQRLLQQLRELRAGADPRSPRGRQVVFPPGLLGDGALQPDSSAPREGPRGVLEPLAPALRQALDAELGRPPADVYEAALREVLPLADRLFEQLERVLRPASYPRWVGGAPTGARVDLRVAMRADVEPGAHDRMWQRKTLPQRRDPGVLLLVDLSGSMSGQPIQHAFRGTVLLLEVLERLRIPCALYGFQDRLIPFRDFGTPLDAERKAVIGTMPLEVDGRRRGGHNRPGDNWDGPVLRAAGKELLAYPARDRLLLVVSDGEPSGPENAEAALRRAVREVSEDVTLIGIGLGPGTAHVGRYYPDAIADIPLAAFPEALGGLLAGLVGTSDWHASGGRR